MGKIIFYVAASIDGFIADENGSVDWLLPYQNVPYDYGYKDFYKKLGFIISGSKTFEQVKDFPEGWSFAGVHTYVLSHRNLPLDGRKDITLWKEGIETLAQRLRSEEKDTWLIGGAALAGSFFNAGMVDELILTVMPLVLAKGVPLFQNINLPQKLQLSGVTDFPNGAVQMGYVIEG